MDHGEERRDVPSSSRTLAGGRVALGDQPDHEVEQVARWKRRQAEKDKEQAREVELRRQQEEKLAEEYREKLQLQREKAKTERESRLGKLRKQHTLHEPSYGDWSEPESEREELLRRYGRKIRVPHSVDAHEQAEVIREERRQRPRKPRVPRVPKSPLVASGARTLAALPDASRTLLAGAGRQSTLAALPDASGADSGVALVSRGPRASIMAFPPNMLQLPGAHGAERRTSVAPLAMVTEVPVEHVGADVEDNHHVPEPCRSLMPRKEILRKRQQQILQKTEVRFYRAQLQKSLRRILDVVELRYNDTERRRQQASWNLAKPLTLAEIKHLNSQAGDL